MITETPWHSLKIGPLCAGCTLCVGGKKLVLFITGKCAQRCFYCPVSEHKFGHDDVYANEWRLEDSLDPKELIEEVKLTNAKGAGITGGDPLMRIDRCVDYIRLLKETFGRKFHIHLYTPLALVNRERLDKLYDAGLDEIRFHPDLDDDTWWPRLELAREFDWDVGVEIPCIPGYEEKTKKLIDFVKDKVQFVNLNELELSDTAAEHYQLHERGFAPKDNISYGVKGSKEAAIELMEYSKGKLPVHFCTAKLKDGVQVRQRLLNRAKEVALPFDEITEDGTLVRGCVYLQKLQPGAKYKERMHVASEQDLLAVKEVLIDHGFDEATIDLKKMRILLPRELVEDNADLIKELGYVPVIIEEYPTADQLEVEVDFL